jgi:predicted  nucleic acid-binding Zn-ribbon protein
LPDVLYYPQLNGLAVVYLLLMSFKCSVPMAQMIEDTIQVRCSRCKGKFRDKAGRIRGGYARQCPSCECMLFFEEGSPNKDIQLALREAERVRKLLRRQEEEAAAMQKPEQPAGDGDTDAAPAASGRRRYDRRVFRSGRT